ncbi:hypothetical protein GCM10020220_085760 [Nonomuraea rubra]
MSEVSLRPACASAPSAAHGAPRYVVAFGSQLRDGLGQAAHVAAVPVDDHGASCPQRQGSDEFDQQEPQGLRAERHGAGEALVLAAGAIDEGGRDHDRSGQARRGGSRDRDGDRGVGVQGQVGSVLLGRSEGDQDGGR